MLFLGFVMDANDLENAISNAKKETVSEAPKMSEDQEVGFHRGPGRKKIGSARVTGIIRL